MRPRYMRTNRRCGEDTVDMATLSERLRKVRALNCSPSDVGMNTYILKIVSFNKLNILTRFL